MPGFTRLYKFSIDQEMVKNIAAKNHVNSLNLATILEMLGKKILMQLYGSKETAAWNVTTTTYMKRDDVGNETDDLKHLVRMSTNKDSLYKIDMEKNIVQIKEGSRSEEIINYHLRREKVIKGIEYMWEDYFIRIGLALDINNAMIVEIEHRALSDPNIALELINQLAKQLITNENNNSTKIKEEDEDDEILLPISSFDFTCPLHLLQYLFDHYHLNDGNEDKDVNLNFTYKHVALLHHLLDV
jgi:hypothetical protein|tara:strand:+ start:169 stop:897 length:729 start_codon:yes stop_codon:yes gene_type:complete